jgi:hypothetical protein
VLLLRIFFYWRHWPQDSGWARLRLQAGRKRLSKLSRRRGAYPQAAPGGLRADPAIRPRRACLHLPPSKAAVNRCALQPLFCAVHDTLWRDTGLYSTAGTTIEEGLETSRMATTAEADITPKGANASPCTSHHCSTSCTLWR